MLEKIYRLLWRFFNYRALNQNDTVSQLLLSIAYSRENLRKKFLYDYGFRAFSQNEEDGILHYIFSMIGHTNKKCIEMCCGKGIESNTANLIINHFWTGLLFDGKAENVRWAKMFYKNHPNSRVFPPIIVQAWITAENLNQLIETNGFKGEVDLFSLDVDGVDYYLIKELDVVTPRVIVLEINHLLGPEKSLSVPYNPYFVAKFSKDGSDYAGASIMAFVKLLKSKNYRFVGTNRFATNAFFVRNDICCSHLDEVEDLGSYFTHDRVVYGITERFKKVAHLPWVEV